MENKKLTEIDIPACSTIAILSKRNSGKSFLAKYLLHQLMKQGKIHSVYIFSKTEMHSRSFNCFPEELIIDHYNPEIIDAIFKNQENSIQKFGKENTPNVCIIFDDLVSSIPVNCPTLNRIFTLSRHYNVQLMLLAQVCRAVFSPCIRQNVDMLFVNKVNDNYLKSVYECIYFDGSYKQFQEFFKKNQTEDYSFLVYDNLSPKPVFYTIKAKPCNFKISCQNKKNTM